MSNMKDVNCIQCGMEMQIHIYASAKRCLCEKCKSNEQGEQTEGTVKGFFDPEGMKGPRIDGKPNKALRRLCCPHHPKDPMKIIGVIKGEWGDLVSLQCRIPKCWTLVQISEQQTGPLRTRVHGDGLEDDPDDIISNLENGTISRWREDNHNE